MSSECEQVSNWLQQLEGTGGALALDENGRCAIMGDGTFEMEIYAVPNDACFYINITILPIPSDDRTGFFEQALTLNLFKQETLGAALAIDPKDNALVLSYSREIEATSLGTFANIIDNLLEAAAKIRDQLGEVTDAPTATTDSVTFPHLMPFAQLV